MATKKERDKLLQRRQMEETQTGKPKSLTPKQLRARARRATAKHQRVSKELFDELYKPIEEWDAEELARCRPRAADGTFRGAPPSWINRELHEKAVEMFKDHVRSQMRVDTATAMQVILTLLDSDEVDDKGRPVVSPAVKLDAAKFLIEHQIGKPTQPVVGDISVRLQGLLGNVLVMPSLDQFGPGGTVIDFPALEPSSSHRVIESTIVEDDEEVDDDGE